MKKSTIILLVCAVILFILGIGFLIFLKTYNYNLNEKIDTNSESDEVSYESTIDTSEESKTEDIEVEYVDISLSDEDNAVVKLSDYENKSVVILFFNENNEDSIKDLKLVQKYYENYNKNIQFLMVNTGDELSEELSQEITMPIYTDIDGEAVEKYSASEVPTFIYVYKDNTIKNAKTGYTTEDSLVANLDILIDNF